MSTPASNGSRTLTVDGALTAKWIGVTVDAAATAGSAVVGCAASCAVRTGDCAVTAGAGAAAPLTGAGADTPRFSDSRGNARSRTKIATTTAIATRTRVNVTGIAQSRRRRRSSRVHVASSQRAGECFDRAWN